MHNNRPQVVFILGNIDRIGDFIWYLFMLLNLYSEKEYNIILITFPDELKPRTNKAVFEILTRHIQVIRSTDGKLIWTNMKYCLDNVSSCHKNRIYLVCNVRKLVTDFYTKFHNKAPVYRPSLSDIQIEQGKRLRRKMDIPESAPIVTLHIREAGYLPCEDPLWSNNYRNTSIENYIPALDYLIGKGFYIIRLGDKSMKQIPIRSPQVIDTPFHPEYCDLVDPYFTYESKFFIGNESGPDFLARAFGVPLLSVNSTIIPNSWAAGNTLFVPKHYYSNKLGRDLTYEEIILSPAVEYFQDYLFQESGVELNENSPEEILMAFKEMNERIDGTYQTSEEDFIEQQVQAIHKKSHAFRRFTIDKDKNPFMNFFGPYLLKLKLSSEYIKANPDFLGHVWNTEYENME